MKKNIDIIEKYSEAFRELINACVWSSDEAVEKLLKLNNENDWSFICTAMDVVGDTSLAIDNFIKFALDGPTRYRDKGEQYLRLYGILSAAYLQQEAVLKLYYLMNCPKPKDIKVKFDILDIRNLRHQLASHSLGCFEPQSQNDIVHPFVPVRISLEGFICEVTKNRGDSIEKYELDDAILKHCEVVIYVLDIIYEKSIKTIFKGQEKKISEHNLILEDLRFERDGNIIVKNANGSNIRFQMKAIPVTRNL